MATETERDQGSETQREGPTDLRGQRGRGALTCPAAASTASRALEEVTAAVVGGAGLGNRKGGLQGSSHSRSHGGAVNPPPLIAHRLRQPRSHTQCRTQSH